MSSNLPSHFCFKLWEPDYCQISQSTFAIRRSRLLVAIQRWLYRHGTDSALVPTGSRQLQCLTTVMGVTEHSLYFPLGLIAVGPERVRPNDLVDLLFGETDETDALLCGARRIVVLLLESRVCGRCRKR